MNPRRVGPPPLRPPVGGVDVLPVHVLVASQRAALGARHYHQAAVLPVYPLEGRPGRDDALCGAEGEVEEVLVEGVAASLAARKSVKLHKAVETLLNPKLNNQNFK